jgi:hypothetical protein
MEEDPSLANLEVLERSLLYQNWKEECRSHKWRMERPGRKAMHSAGGAGAPE